MTPERMRQIEDIFHAACELPPAEREKYLSRACGSDHDLRREVELLLASDGEAVSLIDSPAYELAAPLFASDASNITPGMNIGHYEILSRLGAGGMGEVWRARDSHLKRDVAIMVLLAEFAQDTDRLNAITLQTPPPLTSLKPGIPATLNSLILRMLEKNPGQRPTASEVAHTLSEMDRHGDATTLHEGEDVTVSRRRHTVGRERELNELRLAFNSTKTGRGMLLCVTGEPGIGKTTLVEDFLAELTAENQCTVARGRCSERLAGTEAYLPLLEALESLLHTSFALTGMMKHIAPT